MRDVDPDLLLFLPEFASAQVDAFVDPEGVGSPEGGLEDYEDMFGASWDDEAWDDPGA